MWAAAVLQLQPAECWAGGGTVLQYSPVRVRFWITFRGRARGRGKGLPRGSRWRSLAWLTWLTWPSKKKARSFRSGGSFAQGRERYGNSHSHGHSHPSAQGAVRCKQCLFSAIISGAKPHSLTGHASHDTLRAFDTLHRTRFTEHDRGRGGEARGGEAVCRSELYLHRPRLKTPRCPPRFLSGTVRVHIFFLPK